MNRATGLDRVLVVDQLLEGDICKTFSRLITHVHYKCGIHVINLNYRDHFSLSPYMQAG